MSQMLLAGCEPRRGTRRPPWIIDELIVDSFAGGGGVSMGIERALGRGPDIAINHDLDAIHMHETNHPHASHYCEDVWDIDPLDATRGFPVGLAWFSPDCRHFSRAKGGKPVEGRIRGLAWIVLRWAAKVKPRVIILENVREFAQWGPLSRNRRPIKAKSGITFNRWAQQLRDLGYALEWRILNAADYGAPTHRRRLFVIARRDGQPIVWPEATHGQGKLPYRTAAGCIDWSIPTHSIADRKRPLAAKTTKRIMAGMWRGPAFFIKYYGTGMSASVHEPLHTITAKQRFGLVTVGKQIGMRMLTPRELARCQGFPDEYVLTGTAENQVARIGNSVPPPLVESLVRANYSPIVLCHSA